MDAPNPKRSYPPASNPGPPPRYQMADEVDEYESDDDLDEHDMTVLNTDYAGQRDLPFYPVPYPHNSHYNPSVPPSLRQSATPADDTYDLSEKQAFDTYERGEGTPMPPRHSSRRKSRLDEGDDYQLPQHSARAYQAHRQRRPLIDLIRNEWQNSPYTSSSSSPTDSGRSIPNWIQVLSAPRFRRYVLIVFGIGCLIWGNWHFWAGSQWNEHRLLDDSLKERMRTGDGWFGENMRPEFLAMVHMTTLDQGLIPQTGDGKRLIIVGDVHGCHDEREFFWCRPVGFEADLATAVVNLLAEVQYEARTDHLIFAGDLISKGPSSPAVVDLAMSAHASCVRGNNEDRVLLAYRDMYSHRMTHEQKSKGSKKTPLPPMPGMPEDMVQNEPPEVAVEDESFEHGDSIARRLARSFTKRQIDYLATCPVILDVGRVKGMGDVHVVHAGLIPGVKLEKQDPMGVMQMRTIDLETFVPSSSEKGTAWFKVRQPPHLPLCPVAAANPSRP